jgi:hypothetical protein
LQLPRQVGTVVWGQKPAGLCLRPCIRRYSTSPRHLAPWPVGQGKSKGSGRDLRGSLAGCTHGPIPVDNFELGELGHVAWYRQLGTEHRPILVAVAVWRERDERGGRRQLGLGGHAAAHLCYRRPHARFNRGRQRAGLYWSITGWWRARAYIMIAPTTHGGRSNARFP